MAIQTFLIPFMTWRGTDVISDRNSGSSNKARAVFPKKNKWVLDG